jgi:tRNA threonylcarbamoyladenosine biosynthesis protein TsaB
MKLLALESGDQACSVALWQDGAVIQRSELAPRRQTQLLLPWVEALLAEAGIGLASLDAVAFGHGPGAFTGVRLATSVAQGLAFSHGLPVVGISTLASLAQQLNQQHPQAEGLLPLLDARMNEVYLGAYERDADGLVTALVDDCVCPPDRLPSLPARRWQAGGSGLVHGETLAQQLTLAGQDLALYPQAATVATLAARAFRQGQAVAATDARPVYLRDQVIQGAVR